MKTTIRMFIVALCLVFLSSVFGQTDAVITNCAPVPGGFKLEWVPGREAVVQWSPDLVSTPFADLSAVLPVWQGSYTDTVHGAGNQCFYRVELGAPEGMVLIPAGISSGTNPLGDGESYYPHDSPEPFSIYSYPESYSLTVDAFYMDRYEVTNDEMVEVMQWAYDNGRLTMSSTSVQNAQGDPQELLDLDSDYCRITWNGSSFGMKSTKGSGYPCVEVSWFGAAAYCNYRSEMEGRTPCYNLSDWSCDLDANGYRLPTSDEWEYAARGGLNSKRFPWGDTISDSLANYYSHWDSGAPYNSYDRSSTEGYHPTYNDGVEPYTSPVGSFAANGYGLFDMAGNVWECCNDWFPGFEGTCRVRCGGCWYHYTRFCRVGVRNIYFPSNSGFLQGFRSVLPAN